MIRRNSIATLYSGNILSGIGVDPFSPTDIAGISLWLDATDSSTVLNLSDVEAADGEEVKTWQDKSGNDFHLSQDTANWYPLYRAGATDFTQPSIEFDDVVNGTHLKIATGVIQKTGNTEFYVFSNGSAGGASGTLVSGGDANGHIFGENGQDGASITMFQFAGAVVNQSPYLFNTPAIATLQYDGANSKHWNNETFVGTANAGSGTSNGISLGALRTGGGPCDCELAEVIVYDSVLSDTDREAVYDYLAAKYGI